MAPAGSLEDLAYLVAAVLFILGIKGLTHPRTAVRGNLLSAAGMLLAVVVTLWAGDVVAPWVILAGLLAGGAIGTVAAARIEMTAMPQLVALFNGFGGGASVLVAWAALIESGPQAGARVTAASTASGLIGMVTLLGSLVAFGKLQGLALLRKPLRLPLHQVLNAVLLGIALLLASAILARPGDSGALYPALVAAAGILGVTLVVPIGGADMPVVIALLNSYSGLAAAGTGFVLANHVLIIAGSLVGASGLILSAIMCKAMNRSLANVLFGRIQAAEDALSADAVYEGKIKATSPEEVAMLLEDIRRVVFIPGYGMAAAQAQFAVRDLYQLLSQRGIDVQFAVHPVAGRMPGHMNVLLAEVDIPYERLQDLEASNALLEETDVAIVLGANDVVNPDARENPQSAIAGMPILNADKARTVVVIKRSLSPGFAGIPNPLFARDHCLMLFGDGKAMAQAVSAALKEA